MSIKNPLYKTFRIILLIALLICLISLHAEHVVNYYKFKQNIKHFKSACSIITKQSSTKYRCPISRQAGNNNFFSQYLEDYILSIIFDEIQQGTYIDVGAYHEHIDSVTKHFYLKGWHGINIEPANEFYDAVKTARLRDINLKVGIANKTGTLKFYFMDGLSTLDYKTAQQTLRNRGWPPIKSYNVPITTLNNVLTTHPLKVIDFIKIDVEGFEKQVLQGLNLNENRPKIFIIEATTALTVIPNHESWEPILLRNNYELIIFDGLNRYYLAKEHKHLLEKCIQAAKCACLANKNYKIYSYDNRGNYDIFIGKCTK